MIKRLSLLLGAVALSLGLLLLSGGRKSSSAAAPAASRTDGGRTPVLVELYTSEGCSDCPPANELLTEFGKTQPVPGAEVIPLALHVDYFNSKSWSDRFSSRDFTARQSLYAAAEGHSQDYTPQMIVDGQEEFVGSDRARAARAIALAARAPKASVRITPGPFASGAVPLKIQVDRLPASTVGNSVSVYLAVTEDGLQSQVSGGENANHTLRHSAVVRKLTRLGDAQSERVYTSQQAGVDQQAEALVAGAVDGHHLRRTLRGGHPVSGGAAAQGHPQRRHLPPPARAS